VEKLINDIGIKYLCHFTRAENILTILANGIIPRSEVDRKNLPHLVNDALRLENFKEASCFSIGFPNYKMLYKLRMQNQTAQWAIVIVKRKVLLDKTCYFFKENAAKTEMREGGLQSKRGVKALEELYKEWPGKPSRKQLKIAKEWPTNPQAEVMIEGLIEPEYIEGVAFNSTRLVEHFLLKSPGFKIAYYPSFFSYRQDYEHWK
jgi:hypothetical protein